MRYTSAWNLAALGIGIALLIGGSFYYLAPNWDVPISLIMAGFSYLSAVWSLQVIVFRVWRMWPLMLLATWGTVDGCYALCWSFQNPAALAMMRDANCPASLALHWACGLVWSADRWKDIRKQ